MPVRRAVPFRGQLAPFPDDDRIQPAGVLGERLLLRRGNPEAAELRKVLARQDYGSVARTRENPDLNNC